MYQLLGFNTHNSYKVLYVLEALQSKYEFNIVNLASGENRSASFREWNPHSRVPVLLFEEKSIFESGAICRYLASQAHSNLYPNDPLQRAVIDQWLDSFSCHLGNYIAQLYFEKIIKKMANLGEPVEAVVIDANRRAKFEFKVLNQHLAKYPFIAGSDLSIADYFAFAYIEQTQAIAFDINEFEAIGRWFQQIEALPEINSGRQQMGLAMQKFKAKLKTS